MVFEVSTMVALVFTTVGVVLAVAVYICKKIQRVKRARRHGWKYSRVPTRGIGGSSLTNGHLQNTGNVPSSGRNTANGGVSNGAIGTLVGFQPGPQSETDCLVRASSSDDDESETSNDQPATIQVETEMVNKTTVLTKSGRKFIEQETDEELLQ
ncbi:hypothetical protein BIW11_08709 [Tropilaelaps mercedesae]|uniref:Uncharacterized protein n=1 Tax=Tropilaelaps mercedesae TaxID=418985 RepID=A0A1V9XND0_9ACAR|nr:hypothetical protein BIW11_08709 [Tropilaelaps mercedesae]